MKSLIFNSSSKFVLLAIFLAFSLPSFAITPEQDMLIQAGDVKIGGTLLVPKIQKVNQLVILSSGSGPQDRDETLFDFKIFKVIYNMYRTAKSCVRLGTNLSEFFQFPEVGVEPLHYLPGVGKALELSAS